MLSSVYHDNGKTHGKDERDDFRQPKMNGVMDKPPKRPRPYRAKMKYLAEDVESTLLKLSEDLFSELFEGNALPRYVAIQSLKNQLPQLGWLLFGAEMDRSLPPNTCAMAVTTRSSAPSTVLLRPTTPCYLESVLLTFPPQVYDQICHKSEAEILAALGSNARRPLLRQGEFRPELQCRVRLCEPVDQGLITEDTRLTLVKEKSKETEIHVPEIVADQDIEMEISNFLDLDDLEISHKRKGKITLSVIPLAFPQSHDFLNPPPDPADDLESIVLARIEKLAAIGCFSGDLVTVSSATSSRILRLFSYPDETSSLNALFISPILLHNLGNPAQVTITKHSSLPVGKVLPTAKVVTISRIASAVTTDRTYQSAFLSGLRTYFESCCRMVKRGDVLAIPIDTVLAQTLYNPGEDSYGTILPSGKPDDLAWFKITALESGTTQDATAEQYLIDPSVTRMIQSGIVQEKVISSNLGWKKYLSMAELPDYKLKDPDSKLFAYARKLQQIINASFSPLGASLHTNVLLTSTKRGAGKSTVLKSTAASLGIHVLEIDCYTLSGEGDAKTIGTLRARLDRAGTIAPAIVYLHHLDIISKKSEQDGNDSFGLVSNLVALFDEYSSKENMVIVASVADADKLSEAVRGKFTFELAIPVPSEYERKEIFEYLWAHKTAGSHMVSFVSKSLPFRYALRNDVSMASLALQSAGLTPPDLLSIVEMAKKMALRRLQTLLTNNARVDLNDLIVGSRGVIKVTSDDIEKAIADARSKYSDSIGAPKIPNVRWEDVGGLEGVKKEILDTIEMPLKFPQLFSQGVKKRSGILFYGPPGTGKTLLAKAIATTFSLNFFSVKGPELLNMYIGESEANVRKVFEKARDAKPCVVFFDELDSVAPKRGNQGDSGGVMDRIVSQLLAELDGMNGAGGDGVFVVGATNRPDLLDEALLRPGRFDKMLYLGISDTHEKQLTILQALTRKFKMSQDTDLQQIAAQCPFNLTGADFYAMSSDAMLNAMIRTAGQVDQKIRKYNEQERVGKDLAEITTRWWFQNVATSADTSVEVTMTDFEKAQRELAPSVSYEELQHYVRVRENFEGGKVSDKPTENFGEADQKVITDGIVIDGTMDGSINGLEHSYEHDIQQNGQVNGRTNGSTEQKDRKGKNKVSR